MARARNIKPGFFSNEELVELDMATRLLFIGLWTIADRDGRMEDRPKRIKMQVFPADDVDIDASLAKLANRGFIQRYEANDMHCIQVVNWKKHQSPHIKETASTIPAPDGTVDSDEESGASTGQARDENHASRPDSLIPDSLIPDSLIPDSLIPDSEGGKTSSPPPQPSKPKTQSRKPETPFPEDLELDDDLLKYAETQEVTADEARNEFEKFRNQAHATDRRQRDWRASWRTWITSAIGYGHVGPNAKSKSPSNVKQFHSPYKKDIGFTDEQLVAIARGEIVI